MLILPILTDQAVTVLDTTAIQPIHMSAAVLTSELAVAAGATIYRAELVRTLARVTLVDTLGSLPMHREFLLREPTRISMAGTNIVGLVAATNSTCSERMFR